MPTSPDVLDRARLKPLRRHMRLWSRPKRVGFWFLVAFVVVSMVMAATGAARANSYSPGDDDGYSDPAATTSWDGYFEPDGVGDPASFDGYTDALFSQSADWDVVGSTPDNKIHRPQDTADFISNFKKNYYGHTKGHVHYSQAFHDWWIQAQKDHAADVGHDPVCVSQSNTGPMQCTWDKFTKHDTCIVGSLPDTFTTSSCTFHGSTVDWESLIDSPYWTKRGDLQNKWEARIIFCGTVGLIGLYSKSNVLQGLFGSAGGTCLASRLVK